MHQLVARFTACCSGFTVVSSKLQLEATHRRRIFPGCIQDAIPVSVAEELHYHRLGSELSPVRLGSRRPPEAVTSHQLRGKSCEVSEPRQDLLRQVGEGAVLLQTFFKVEGCLCVICLLDQPAFYSKCAGPSDSQLLSFQCWRHAVAV